MVDRYTSRPSSLENQITPFDREIEVVQAQASSVIGISAERQFGFSKHWI